MMNTMEENEKKTERTYDVFIPGEVIDLCVPSRDPWVIGQWYRWFNNQSVNRYLDHGIYPNTFEKQLRYYESLLTDSGRIVLLIKPKKKDYLVGVVSLSSINQFQRHCDIALVIGYQDSTSESIFYAMEAKCRMTEYAFESVGVERINSGQAIDLIKWQRWQILFGYQIEGIMRNHFRKGCRVSDALLSSCLLEDYLRLREKRGGSLWPGKSEMLKLIRNLPEESAIDKLREFLGKERRIFETHMLT